MVGYLLAFFYLGLRGYDRFTQIELWAEDGAVMLRDALTKGWPSVLHPTDATPQVLQRFIGLFAYSVFPIEYFPPVMAFSALAINALVLGQFGRSTYRWLVPNDRMRYLAVIALCSVPGLTEMTGNVANTNWFLFFGCCLIFLQDPTKKLSVINLFFLSISLVSMGTGVLLLPLAMWRIWIRESRKDRADWIAFILILIHILLLRLFKSNTFFEIPTEAFSIWLKTYWRVLLESFFLQPWVGDKLTIALFDPENRFIHSVLSGILVSTFGYFAWKNRNERHGSVALVLLFLISLWPVLCWIGRPGSITTFRNDTPSSWYFSHRYSFPTAFTAVLTWIVLLPRKRIIQALFCLLVVAHSYGRWNIPAYGKENRWKTAGPLLSQSLRDGNPKKVRIPVYPERLDFDYER